MIRLIFFTCVIIMVNVTNKNSVGSTGLLTKGGHSCLTKCVHHDDGKGGYYWCRKGSKIEKKKVRKDRAKRAPKKKIGIPGPIADVINPSVGSAWDYCDPVNLTEPFVQLSAISKLWCQDECRMLDDGGHYSCHTLYGSDYCSPLDGFTYENEQCTSLCGKHGYDYYWCYTSNSWNYCGYWKAPNEKKWLIEFTDDDNICADYCGKKEESYNWCWYVSVKEFEVPVASLTDPKGFLTDLIIGNVLAGSRLLYWDYC